MFLERLLKITTSRNATDRLATYAGCLVAVSIAILIRIAAAPLLGGRQNYVFFYPVVFACAFLAGWRGGLLATALSGVAGYWLFIGERSWRVDAPATASAFLFVVNGALVTLLITGMWRAIEELGRERGRAEARAALHAELFGDLNARTGQFLRLVGEVLAEQSRQEARTGAATALTEAAGHAALLARVHSEAAGTAPDLVELQPFLTEVLRPRAEMVEVRVAEGPSIRIARDDAVSLGVVLLTHLDQRGEGLAIDVRLGRTSDRVSLRMTATGGGAVAPDRPGLLVRSMLKQLRGKVALELDGLSLDQLLADAAVMMTGRHGSTLH